MRDWSPTSPRAHDYDVCVVGLGGHGSAIAAHLVQRGAKVLGLDKFGPVHDQGSSHGRSRIFRTAYFEDPRYVPLLKRALVLWKALRDGERDADSAASEALADDDGLKATAHAAPGEELIKMTGGLMIGPKDELDAGTGVLGGTMASILQHNLEHEVLDPQEVNQRWPGAFCLGPGEAALFETNAAVLVPELCIAAHLRVAKQHGAELRFNEPLATWTELKEKDTANHEEDSHDDDDQRGGGGTPGGFEVMTALGNRFTCAQVVLSVGAWASSVWAEQELPEVPISIERRVLHWFNPDVPDAGTSNDLVSNASGAITTAEETTNAAAAAVANNVPTTAAAKDAAEALAPASNAVGVYDNVPIFVWEPKGGVEFYGFPTQPSGTVSSSSSSSSSSSVHSEDTTHPKALGGVKAAMHGGRGTIPGAQLAQPEDLRSAPRPSTSSSIPAPDLSSDTEENRELAEGKSYVHDDSYAGPVASAAEVSAFRAALSGKLPPLAAAQHVASVVCMYTFTPNQHFLVDWHPKHAGSLLLVSPCSGHGFKFCSVIGEECALLLQTGKSDLDISLFSIDEHIKSCSLKANA